VHVARLVRFDHRRPAARELARGWTVRRGSFAPGIAAVHLSGPGAAGELPAEGVTALAVRRRQDRWDWLCQAPGGPEAVAAALADADAARAVREAAAGDAAERFAVPLPGGRTLPLGRRTAVMGVVNVTPDSFSDGGRWLAPEAAVEHGLALVAQGADLLDVGGESTRPGAAPVSAGDEAARVVPVIRGLAAQTDVPVSVDTSKAAVLAAAAEAGAAMLNDVTALEGDARMAAAAAAAGVAVVLMHMRGTPRSMQNKPRYADVVTEVTEYLAGRCRAAEAAGIAPEATLVDPGIGFGKTLAHNLELLGRLRELRALGRPVLVGTSRKSFLGRLLDAEVDARAWGTAASVAAAAAAGASVVRVHDVAEMTEVARVADAVAVGGVDDA
jgi:dihydropteroate synthase